MFTGTVVSHYRVLEKIGQGGLGDVYLAVDTVLNRRVALKFLRTPNVDASGRDEILGEARSAASLDHPYACKVFEIGNHEGKAFIVMEFLEGQTLAQRLLASPMPMQEVLKTAIEISEALAEAHAKQIVHCDLKPGNIMITINGHVKLMDFGLARGVRKASVMPGDETVPATDGCVKGTPAYMAPEQARGEKVDSRVDVFAFGIILFEMLAGVHPFRRNTTETVIAAILHEEPPRIEQLVPAIPPALTLVLERALAKRPEDRYASARDVWSDLVRVRSNEAVQASSAAVPAIAILPFTDFSPERNQEYFCEGLAEELITSLGRLDQLRVASRTAASRFRHGDIDLREIGQALKVSFILEGSVRKSGDRLRIAVKLVDLKNGYPIWSEKYDRRLEDIFEIQDEISNTIVEKLRITFSLPASGKPGQSSPQNLRAYEHYLKGRYFWNKRTEENLTLSIDQFERALAEDPQYALAHAGLADAYLTLGLYGAEPPQKVMPLAARAAERALQINAQLPEALTSRACIRAIFEWDWGTAAREFDAAIQANPRYAQARQWYAINCLAPLGHFDRAKQELQQAAEFEPLSLAIATSLGLLHSFQRDYDQAIARFRSVLELDEGFGIAHYFLGQVYLSKRMYPEAIAGLERAVALTRRSSETLAALGYAQAASGLRKEALEALSELAQRGTHRYVSPVVIAQIEIGLQQYDSAMNNIEEACRLRATDLMWVNSNPIFDSVRTHRRVVGVLQKVGLQASPRSFKGGWGT